MCGFEWEKQGKRRVPDEWVGRWWAGRLGMDRHANITSDFNESKSDKQMMMMMVVGNTDVVYDKYDIIYVGVNEAQ